MGGEIACALGRAQAHGTGAVDGGDRHGKADRRERIEGRATHIEADPAAIPAHRAGRVHGSLPQVGRIERGLEVVRPCEVAVQPQPRGEDESGGEMGAIAGASAAVVGVAGVAREGKAGKGAPGAGAFELPGPGVIQPADCEADVRAGPVVRDLERALRQAAIRHCRIAAHARGGERRLRARPEAVVPGGGEHAEDSVAPLGVPIGREGPCAAVPARAQRLQRGAEPGSRDVLALQPQVHGVECRARATLDALVVVVIGDEREAESRAPAAEKRAAVVRGLYLSGGYPHLRRGFRGALAERDEIDAQRGRQHDHVVASERQVRHAVPVDLEPRGPAPAVHHDLPGAVDAAPGDVDPRDMGEQVRQRLDVRENKRVGIERVARAARQRPSGDRLGEYGEVVRQGVAGGGVLGGRRRGVAREGVAARRAVDLSGGSDRDEQERGRAREAAGHAPARLRMNSVKSRTPTAVGPLAWCGPSASVYAVPAMSRCTQGYPSTNSRRNHPPAIDPAPRPPEFLTSAMSDLSRSRYSSHSGSGQQRSPARSPASRTSARRASSFPISPIATWPRATTTAPVSVAMSITAAGLKRRTYDRASHRMRRPSASVLMISIVLPKWLLTTSPGFTACPEGRFSVEGMTPRTLTFGWSSPTVSKVPSTAAAPDMSNFMSSMFCAGLIEIPPESNVTPLPMSATGGAPPPPRCSSTMKRGSCRYPAPRRAARPCLPARASRGRAP